MELSKIIAELTPAKSGPAEAAANGATPSSGDFASTLQSVAEAEVSSGAVAAAPNPVPAIAMPAALPAGEIADAQGAQAAGLILPETEDGPAIAAPESATAPVAADGAMPDLEQALDFTPGQDPFAGQSDPAAVSSTSVAAAGVPPATVVSATATAIVPVANGANLLPVSGPLPPAAKAEATTETAAATLLAASASAPAATAESEAPSSSSPTAAALADKTVINSEPGRPNMSVPAPLMLNGRNTAEQQLSHQQQQSQHAGDDASPHEAPARPPLESAPSAFRLTEGAMPTVTAATRPALPHPTHMAVAAVPPSPAPPESALQAGVSNTVEPFRFTNLPGEATKPGTELAHQLAPLRHLKLAYGSGSAADQVALQLSRGLKGGMERISLQLYPESLGRIDIKLDLHQDGRIAARVMADNPQTLDLLQRDARLLERALQDAGLDTNGSSLSFSLRDGAAYQREAAAERQAGRAARLLLESDLAAPEAALAWQMPADPGRIDIRV